MEDAFDARAMIRKGTVTAVDDSGQVQMVTVKTSAGAIYTAEVHQFFGHASVPPVNGCTALLFCVGGDPANMVALLTNPSKRFGNQAQGESVLYSAGGSRVAIRQGGTVQIKGFATVTIDAPTVAITVTGDVTINAASSITLTTPVVSISDNLSVGTGATGTFPTATGQNVTVQDGIITNIF